MGYEEHGQGEPEQLREALREALIRLGGWLRRTDIIDGDLCDPRDPDTWEEWPTLGMTPATPTHLLLPECDSIPITAGEIVALTRGFSSSKRHEGRGLLFAQRYIVEVSVDHESGSWAAVEQRVGPEGERRPSFAASVSHSGQVFQCSIAMGSVEHALSVIAHGLFWDKLNPPYREEQCFLTVEPVTDKSVALLNDVIEVYRQHLHERSGLSLTLYDDFTSADHQGAIGPQPREGDIESGSGCLGEFECSRGLVDLARLYNDSHGERPSMAILALVKVLEFVAVTHSRRKLFERFRRALRANQSGHYSAKLILSLVPVFKDASRSSENHLVELVRDIGEVAALSPLAPPSLSRLRSIRGDSSEKDRRAALTDLGECLVATRNQHAHARPNFSPSGKECPDESLRDLVACVSVLARLAIQWFEDQPDELRVCD